MTIACLFGSKNDGPQAIHLSECLSSFGISSQIIYLSAHRAPKELGEFLAADSHNFSALVGSAGLAAHLAGTMAAHTYLPVFGFPLKGAFQGLDSFLSTLQMPKGVPVLTSGVENPRPIAKFLNQSKNWKEIFAISISPQNANHPLWEKNQSLISDLKVEIIRELTPSGQCPRLEIINLNERPDPESDLVVPSSAAGDGPEQALILLERAAQSALWVGTGRLDNALLALARVKTSWRTSRLDILKDYQTGRKK